MILIKVPRVLIGTYEGKYYKTVEEYSLTSDALLKINAKSNTDSKQTALCLAFKIFFKIVLFIIQLAFP